MHLIHRCLLTAIVLAVLGAGCRAEATEGRVRPPECANDMWYPSDQDELAKAIDGYLDKANPPSLPGKPAALVCPHAGIRYSGPIAATAYKTLKGHTYKRVIVLAFTHRHRLKGASILKGVSAYATPLGKIPVDRDACDRLLARPEFDTHAAMHKGEHSLEIQLPFLQRVLSDFKLVPVLVGEIDLAVYDRMAEALAPLVDDQTLIVVSSDFTHYGRRFLFVPFTEDIPENLKRIDLSAAERIMALDVDGFLKKLDENGCGNPNYRRPQSICGRMPITLMMMILNKVGTYKGIRLAYDTSGRMTGDYANSVSYVALALVKTGDKPRKAAAEATPDTGTLSEADRKTLLRIARDAATRVLQGKGRINPRLPKYAITEALECKCGAFVTLRNGGKLRGCIGNIISRGALVDSVVDNAINAATRDYRFKSNPVTAEEMKDISIEVSALSPLRQVGSASDIVLGTHGVVLTRGMRRAVFLPQVATETGWDRETFLSRLCMKAGLAPDAWKKDGTRFDVFTAEVFGEHEVGHGSE